MCTLYYIYVCEQQDPIPNDSSSQWILQITSVLLFLIADAESFPRVPPKKNCYLCISR